MCPTWPRVTKRDQRLSKSAPSITRGHVGLEWFGVARAHIVTRLAARPFQGEAHRGAKLQCTP
ncbi:hypothetical protein ACFL7M_07330 [Thermodesulfobacteriota bacterium]